MSGGTTQLDARWRHWYRRALPAYWIFLFMATHLPKLRLGMPGLPWVDKVAHFGAFALLAFLFWRCAEAGRTPLSGRFVWFAGAVLLPYAALDEYLQGPVGRGVELLDFAANAAGVVSVLTVMEWRRRK